MRHSPSMLRRAPIAWAASSRILRPRAANGSNRSIAAIWPYRCTGTMARVRGVMARPTAAGSMLKVSGSTSTNTGVPPALWIAPAVAKNVNGVVMTSSPGFRPSALSGSRSASVPLAQAIAYFAWESRHPCLELRHRGAHHELLRLDHRLHGGQDLVLDRAVLCDEVEQRDVHEVRTLLGGATGRRLPSDSS